MPFVGKAVFAKPPPIYRAHRGARPSLTAGLAAFPAGSLLSNGRGAVAPSTLSADPGIKSAAPLDPNRPLAQESASGSNASLVITAVGSLLLSSPTGALPAFDPAIVALLA